jgi:hypothetical protein
VVVSFTDLRIDVVGSKQLTAGSTGFTECGEQFIHGEQRAGQSVDDQNPAFERATAGWPLLSSRWCGWKIRWAT